MRPEMEAMYQFCVVFCVSCVVLGPFRPVFVVVLSVVVHSVLANRLEVLPPLLEKITGEFSRVRNGPILSTRPGHSPGFRTWRILESAGNRSKLPETPPKVANGF